LDEMMKETDFKATVAGADYALAASPARYAVERGDWNAASQLSVRPSSFNYVMAMSHFARALGAARSGKPEAAKADVAKLGELYGDMLLERGMAQEALAAFEATKTKEPNRFRGYAGAAKAAEKLGDRPAAKANYEKLISLVAQPNSDRPEIRTAYQFLGKG